MTEEIRQKLTGAVIGLARTCENYPFLLFVSSMIFIFLIPSEKER